MAPDDILPADEIDDDDNQTSTDPQGEAAAEAVSHQRVWEDEVGTGDLVPFDPTKYRPKLTPEQSAAAEKPKE